jgi:Rad3-related DNA helicase
MLDFIETHVNPLLSCVFGAASATALWHWLRSRALQRLLGEVVQENDKLKAQVDAWEKFSQEQLQKQAQRKPKRKKESINAQGQAERTASTGHSKDGGGQEGQGLGTKENRDIGQSSREGGGGTGGA